MTKFTNTEFMQGLQASSMFHLPKVNDVFQNKDRANYGSCVLLSETEWLENQRLEKNLYYEQYKIYHNKSYNRYFHENQQNLIQKHQMWV